MAEKRITYRKKAELTPTPVTIPSTENYDEPAEWMLSERGRQAIAMANRMNKTSAGLYASLPIICRGMACKYHERCPLVRMNIAPYGEVCAIEADMAQRLYAQYVNDFGIKPEDETYFVDMGFIKEMIDIDISMDRANRAIAVDGDFIKDVVVAVANDGRPLKKPELHQGVILKEKLQKRKDSIYKQMIATRESKLAAKAVGSIDPTKMASDIIAKAMSLNLIPNAIHPMDIDISAIVKDDEEKEVENDGTASEQGNQTGI